MGLNLKYGWLVKDNERIFLSRVRKYRMEKSCGVVTIHFEDGWIENFNFEGDKAEEFIVALDTFFGVGENESTIELKP